MPRGMGYSLRILCRVDSPPPRAGVVRPQGSGPASATATRRLSALILTRATGNAPEPPPQRPDADR